MVNTSQLLLTTLDELDKDKLKRFQWYLTRENALEGFSHIPKAQLENADVQDTVDKMVETYQERDAVEITLLILRKMEQNNLAGKLESKLREVYSSLDHSISGDPAAPVYQEVRDRLKYTLKQRYEHILDGTSTRGHRKFLNDVYTELFIVEDETGGVIHEHEIMQVEASSKGFNMGGRPIKCSDIFELQSNTRRRNKKVLTIGVAGVGKTVSVNKFILDWAEGQNNQDIDFIFPISFRELNGMKDKEFSLIELLHECILDSGDLNALPPGEGKVMFILDGLDECRLALDFHEKEKVKKVDEKTTVGALITNLIKANLLPSALIWITSRPAAAHQVPRMYIDQVTEVRGFSDEQKEEYFRKHITTDQEVANKVVSHVKKSKILHIMCHIPVFCRISATVLQPMLADGTNKGTPTTLTGMYTQFLILQMNLMRQKYKSDQTNLFKKKYPAARIILRLGKLAFRQLERGHLMFYEEDLRECGIDVSEGSVYSGVCTQIFSKEQGASERMVFSFIHLSVQEFLAAIYVFHSHCSKKKNPLKRKTARNRIKWLSKNITDLHRSAIRKALKSKTGHLDLFLRFLLGLSVELNQKNLNELLPRAIIRRQKVEETVKYIKRKLNKNISSERAINLLHCLNELKDDSLVSEIQKHLSSGNLSRENISNTQWSALAFVLLMSEDSWEKFELKKYGGSDEVLERLLPVLKNTRCALLNDSKLTEKSCEAVASVLQSVNCPLRELDLSNNDLQDSGVKLFSAGLENPHCKLEMLRLAGCKLSEHSCVNVLSALNSKNSTLRELDLSYNDLKDEGVKQICVGLKYPHCKLKILRLSGCSVTEEGCSSLASALSSNPSHLRELDLSCNHPGDSGVNLLLARLEDPHCQLNTLKVDHGGEFRVKPGPRKYACHLTLDPKTAQPFLLLSERNRKATRIRVRQLYPDHPERFDARYQVMCRESLTGRCYWEAEWSGDAAIGMMYKGISRKGQGDDCEFGCNDKSWSLFCYESFFSAWHNKANTDIPASPSHTHRIGVYLDCLAGTLSFYNVSSDTHTLTHLHTFHSTFTEPLYAGFGIWSYNSSVSLCQIE
ncbi:NACHT, LRR and PYD domains-containing protein 12-like [Chanos chanos]|uniref:NACHT, LRR and PYD domains-containing protein 12-like n=1 Tax=Chanos chanos TaxID=29144 RepID=A0A6J2VX63_CHACN|nr:NACHT, LRR and PYD domains-containing protein 12-like [Chanos chanos]